MKKILVMLICIEGLLGCRADHRGDRSSQRQILIMVDFSISAKADQPAYKSYISQIISVVLPDTRVVLGKIVDNTEATFIPIADERFPKYNMLTGNKIVYEEQKEAAVKILLARFDSVAQYTNYSKRTDIISSLRIAENLFRDSHGRKMIIFLSDMIEDTPAIHLETAAITDDYIRTTIERLRKQELIPDLQSYTIYVAGATARDNERYRAIQRFWEEVFRTAGATLKAYSRSLIDFHIESEEPK